jgi:hypothetical protein
MEIVAAGSHGHVRWQTEGLPAWLKAATNGPALQLSGQPTARGKSSFTVGVEDLDALDSGPNHRPSTIASVSPVRYELEVIEPKPTPGPLRVLTQVLPDAIVGSRFQADIAARGGEGPIKFAGNASNATWLEIATSGRLSGTPDSPGSTSPPVALRLTTLAIGRNEMTLADVPDLVAVKGQPFSFQFIGIGGVLPYRIQVDGTLPAGLSFDTHSNRVSGTPEQTGRFALRLTARDSSPKGSTTQKDLRILVLSSQGWTWFVQMLAVTGIITAALAALAWVITWTKRQPRYVERKKGPKHPTSWKPKQR